MTTEQPGLGASLGGSWYEAWRAHPMRLGRDEQPLAALMLGLIQQLPTCAITAWQPGAASSREIERAAGMLGAQCARGGVSSFDLSAALLALRAVAPVALTALCEWLEAIAHDAYARAGTESLAETHAQQLEAGTPMGLVQDVPFLFLLGQPSVASLRATLGRAELLTISVGSRVFVMDVAGLADPAATSISQTVPPFLCTVQRQRLRVCVVGLPVPLQRMWKQAGAIFHATASFQLGVAWALEQRAND